MAEHREEIGIDKIFSVQRADTKAAAHVLLRVKQPVGNSESYVIIGTDGDLAFRGSLNASEYSRMRAPSFKGTDQTWSQLVCTLILKQRPAAPIVSVAGAALTAHVTDRKLTLVIRQLVEDGIMLRLGSVDLSRDDTLLDSIELFEWTVAAVKETETLGRSLTTLHDQLRDRSDEIERLREHLQELVEVKQTFQRQIIVNFQALLNSKKMKIREQQRLLARTKIGTSAAVNVDHNRSMTEESRIHRSVKRKFIGKSLDTGRTIAKDADSLVWGGQSDCNVDDQIARTPSPKMSDRSSENLALANGKSPSSPVTIEKHAESEPNDLQDDESSEQDFVDTEDDEL